jgi:hypothetical protein
VQNSLLLVYSRPTEGMEDVYNSWYSDQHLNDVLSVPGFVAAQRFRVEEAATPSNVPASSPCYAAIYEIEPGQVEAAQEALSAAVKSGRIAISESLDKSSVRRVLLRAISERCCCPPVN